MSVTATGDPAPRREEIEMEWLRLLLETCGAVPADEPSAVVWLALLVALSASAVALLALRLALRVVGRRRPPEA